VKLSVILPCYNAAGVLTTQLDALAVQQWPPSFQVEVIFVDNGSTDESVRIAERYQSRLPSFRIIKAHDRRSRPYARNAGARAATGDALLFCDADDEVAPGWLEAMGQALCSHDFVACRFETTKLNPAWLQRSRGNPQQDGLQRLWYPPYLLYAGGSSLGVRRALHDAVGGFDESMPFLEDAEYCLRVQQYSGKELHFVPDAVVHIRHRTSLSALYGQAYCWAQYNEFLYKRYRREDGKDRTRWAAYRKEWMWLLTNLLQFLRYREGRVQLVWRVGWQLGLLKGCILYRVPPVSL
jgi:glycosyltransferase involved in cell wall biosynthesis